MRVIDLIERKGDDGVRGTEKVGNVRADGLGFDRGARIKLEYFPGWSG